MLESLNELLSIIDIMLDSKRKRHIIGGIFLSASLLFGGFAFTIITIKGD